MFKIKYNNILTAVGQKDDEYDFERIKTSQNLTKNHKLSPMFNGQ